MSDTPQIYKSLCAISKEIGAIGKEKKNQQQGFMFRGIDQVMNTLHPLLVEFGVFIVPEIVESHREERQTKSGGNIIYTIHKVKYHFTAMDGSEVCATVIGEGMDSADKSSNKAMAIAFKYACFQMFCIPTEELSADDPDNYTTEPSKPAPKPKPAPKQAASEVMNMEVQEQVERFLSNCHTKDDLAAFCEAWGNQLQTDANIMAMYQKRKSEILGKK